MSAALSQAGTGFGTAHSTRVADLAARLDRLPATRSIWTMVMILSLGGYFEYYDTYLTAYVSPGLIKAGIFHAGKEGLFGLPDQASFGSSIFIGFLIGTFCLGSVSDRFGRRRIFTFALLWYCLGTVIMAMQSSALGVDFWRAFTGIGLGLEHVTIDAYIAEIVPKSVRGRAFTVALFVFSSAVPSAALVGWLLVPATPFGIEGWRVAAMLTAIGAVAVWWIRLKLPESPRWLAQQGRHDEAAQVLDLLESRVRADLGGAPLPPPGPAMEETQGESSYRELFRPPYRRRTIMLSVFNFFQTVGVFGFVSWIPALLMSQGASIAHSLQYSFIISVAAPVGPLLWTSLADRIERKWLTVAGAFGIAVFGLLFSIGGGASYVITMGVAVQLSITLLTSTYVAYQAELFPTRVRGRAVGLVYSMSRVSAVLTSLMVGFFLENFGDIGVFVFIAGSMAMVMVSIGVFGPRTNGLSLEEIEH